jgi:exosortase H (IPTLxxWG-CTERM-specific)
MAPKRTPRSAPRPDRPRDTPDGPDAPRPDRRREMWFLGVFLALLIGGFTAIALKPVNDNVIEPFTAGIAKVSGVALNLLGQEVVRTGTILRSPRFAVNIKNGCNGVETVLIFGAAVLAFPAPWKSRLIGLGLGILAIQALNLVRVVALFLTGAYFPTFFDSSHTVVWQAIVVLFGVLLWIFWARRFATPAPATPATAT